MTYDQQRDVDNEGQRAHWGAMTPSEVRAVEGMPEPQKADAGLPLTAAEKAAILSAADLINEVLYDERNDIWGRHMLRLLDAETKLRAMVEPA